MIRWIKNATVSTKTYAGQDITAGAYYQIQPQELVTWQNNGTLITDIVSGDAVVAKDDSGNNDITNYVDGLNYLKDITNPVDTDQSMIVRTKAAKSGWTYHLCGIEFETSKLNSIYHKDIDGNDLNEATIKFYDSNNNELTTQGSLDTSCVKTVVDFEPTYDYEIIGGTVKTYNNITSDYRIWVRAVPDLTVAQGGSKDMVDNINLKFIDPNNGVEADGRASKYMTYNATYHTNKLRLVVKHPAGGQETMMIAFEMYRV